jgi:hypothetical protein
VLRTRLGSNCGPVVKKSTELMNNKQHTGCMKAYISTKLLDLIRIIWQIVYKEIRHYAKSQELKEKLNSDGTL